nr:MAG TPA: PVL ORF-50-like family [Caudoviricetes sp.]
MIKEPFNVLGHRIDGELLAAANANGLSRAGIERRIRISGWSAEQACRTPKIDPHVNFKHSQQKRQNPKPIPTGTVAGNLKVYHMPIEEVRRKYGEPGKLMHPERTKKGWIG